MKTDTLFYRLFLQRPELVFDLTTWPKPVNVAYSFQSVEVKQAAFRIDGVFMPPDGQLECPLIFAEVQYQKDPKIYARLVSEIALYLYQTAPRHDWRAVVIFPNQNTEPRGSEHYREFFDSGRIQAIYLDQLPKQAQGLGVQLIHLIGVDEVSVPEQLKTIKSAINASPTASQSAWLDLLETILVYKLPRLSRDEVKEMLGDILNVQLKQTRFYQDVFAEGQQEGQKKGRQEGRKEGRKEGRQEGEVMMLLRLLEQRFGAVPDSIRSRLKQADMDTLLVWSERVLTCTTLDEVLDK